MISPQLARVSNSHFNLQPLPAIEINVGELVHQTLLDKVQKQKLLMSRLLVSGAVRAVTPADLLRVSGVLDPDAYETKVPRQFYLTRPTFYSFREAHIFSEVPGARLRRGFYPVGEYGSAGTVPEMLLFLLEHAAQVRLLVMAYREIYLFGDCHDFTHSFTGVLSMEGGKLCFRRKRAESLPTTVGSRFILFEQSLDQSPVAPR